MRKLIIFSAISLIWFQGIITAQDESESQAKIRIQNMIWKSGDKDFSVTQPLDKWKNESAVFLCKKYEYEVRKEILVNYIFENIYAHNRILLLDKAAVEKYSTFSFDVSRDLGNYFSWASSRKVYVGLKVIKPDGTENIVPINENQTDRISNKYNEKKYQKIAIPNLQPGDILDYYTATESQIVGSYYYFGFSPVIFPLAEEYPVLKQSVRMHIMRKCYLSGRSLNGAPEFKLISNRNSKDVVWLMEDSVREKIKSEDFDLPLREIPCLLFQAIFTNNMALNNQYFFIDKEDKLKNSISDDEFKSYFQFLKNDLSYRNLSQKIIKYWKKNCKNEKDPGELAKKAYYFLREYLYGSNFIKDIASNEFSRGKISDFAFMSAMSKAFTQKGIPHSLIITTPRELGTINDIVIRDQMGYMIEVNTPKPFYLSGFNLYSTHDIIENSYQGTRAKSSKSYTDFDTDTPVEDESIPVDKPSENKEVQELNVFFDPQTADSLDCQLHTQATGLQKNYLQYQFLNLGDRVKEFEKNRFNLKINEITNPNILEAFRNALVSDSTEQFKDEQDYFKKSYGTEHIKLKEHKVIQPGIWEDASELIFQDHFTIGDFITQTGSQFMINIGELIGNQAKYDKTDTLRTCDIYIDYTREWNHKLRFHIPKGFQVKGIENLDITVDNKAGNFTSKARMNESTLEIDIIKQYKTNFLPKTKWLEFKQFLDAAEEFQSRKIILIPAEGGQI